MATKPTVGRIVRYHTVRSDPGGVAPGGVQAAIIAHVFNDSCVNLMVIDPSGIPYSRTSVYLRQDNEVPPDHEYADWPQRES